MASVLTRGARRQRLLEFGAIATFGLLACWSLSRLWLESGRGSFFVIAGAGVLGWVATDLLSGLVHWLFDSWGTRDTPFFGAAFIHPFREHRDDPLAMARHDFVETNGSSCLGSLPFLVAASTMSMRSLPGIALQAFILFTALGLMVANQCHKWAHVRKAPAPVRWAQRLRLVLPPEQHLLHHAAPHRSHYCTASGWLNVPLNLVLRAWR